MTETNMVTQFFNWLLAGFARKRVHRCANTMLRMDDRLLRDIGLTQRDVVNCMSSPAHMKDHCLPARRSDNLDKSAAAGAQGNAPADGLTAAAGPHLSWP